MSLNSQHGRIGERLYRILPLSVTTLAIKGLDFEADYSVPRGIFSKSLATAIQTGSRAFILCTRSRECKSLWILGKPSAVMRLTSARGSGSVSPLGF